MYIVYARVMNYVRINKVNRRRLFSKSDISIPFSLGLRNRKTDYILFSFYDILFRRLTIELGTDKLIFKKKIQRKLFTLITFYEINVIIKQFQPILFGKCL